MSSVPIPLPARGGWVGSMRPQLWCTSESSRHSAALWRQSRKPGLHVAVTRVVPILDHISPPLTGGSMNSLYAVAAVLLHPYPLLSTGSGLVYSGSDLNTFFVSIVAIHTMLHHIVITVIWGMLLHFKSIFILHMYLNMLVKPKWVKHFHYHA